MEFKDRLRQLRTECGFSGEELGRKIGVSKAAIGNYESGYRKPRPEQLKAIADVFNVDMDYLLCRTNTKLHVSFEESRMKYLLNKLNEDGKREAVKRVEELTFIPSYVNNDFALNAASARSDVTAADTVLTDCVMTDDSYRTIDEQIE